MPESLQADVIVPVSSNPAMALGCLVSVLEFSGETLHRLIVVDDASSDPDMQSALQGLATLDRRVRLLRNDHSQGWVATCNRGLDEHLGDAVLLDREIRVTHGWLRELAEVANLDERTACVTPVLENALTTQAAHEGALVSAACAGLPRWTEIPAGMGLCLYMRGRVLDLIGGLDPACDMGFTAAHDWAMRAQAMGFVAKRANHAFVTHVGSVSSWRPHEESAVQSSPILKERHPHYVPQVDRFRTTVDCQLAAHAVRVESRGKLRVAIDFRHMPPFTVGSSVYALNLAHELSCRHEIELTLVVRDPSQAHGIPARIVHDGHSFDDIEVIHRPAQVFDPADLALLFRSPAHLVMTCLDLIAHRVQGIFPDQRAADSYRSTSYLVAQAAQATIAISDSAKREIAAE
jgi:GT2 family glycosyltransferase